MKLLFGPRIVFGLLGAALLVWLLTFKITWIILSGLLAMTLVLIAWDYIACAIGENTWKPKGWL